MNKELNGLEIAIIGMAGKFPGAGNIDEYWDNLIKGKESISVFSDQELLDAGVEREVIHHPNYVKAKGYIEDGDQFDTEFFNMSPIEAKITDPQVRLFYECVWKALEDSGYCKSTYPGLIGLYGGASNHLRWQASAFLSNHSDMLGSFTVNQLANKDFMCMQISHKLNLRGPSVSLNTACSTSLAAVHIAAQSLLNGECDIALAGGVTLSLPFQSGYMYQEGMVLSPDGHCRAFDEHGNGSVPGDGAGVVALKRYDEAVDDGDFIYAIIKGSAMNNDGNQKSNFTAPSIEGQAQAIETAMQLAEVDSDTIRFVETHGTATALGDAIEIEALKCSFLQREKPYCYLGAVKCNIGHLDAAAGIAGLIKAALCINHKMLPGMINHDKNNEKLRMEDSPFMVNTKLLDLSNEPAPLRGGVSSFGIGGTNVHVILEEADKPRITSAGRNINLLPFSAKTESSLEQYLVEFNSYIKRNPHVKLQDVAYTLQVGREAFLHRGFITAGDVNDVISLLDTVKNPKVKPSRKIFRNLITGKKSTVFLFPGLGNQYVDMGVDLYHSEPYFREEINRCFEIADRYTEEPIRSILYPGPDREYAENRMKQINNNQVIVFVFEYALGRYMMHLGIKPDYLLGYSMGEYTAGALAEIFTLEDAIRLIVKRGYYISRMNKGAMLSVPMTEHEISTLLPENVYLCIENGPSCIVGGGEDAIAAFEQVLKTKRIMCVRVETTHAIHTKLMEPMIEEYRKELENAAMSPPKIPIVSNLTADYMTENEAISPQYWVNQLVSTVHFSDCIQCLLDEEKPLLLLEVGPDRSISTLLRYKVTRDSGHSILNLIRNPQEKLDDQHYFFNRLGQIWMQGVDIKWEGLYDEEKRNRITLPGYSFERKSYMLDSINLSRIPEKKKNTVQELTKKPKIKDWFYQFLWKEKKFEPVVCGKDSKHYLVFAEKQKVQQELLAKLRKQGNAVTAVYAGEHFRQCEHDYEIHAENKEHYQFLLKDLKEKGIHCFDVIYLWSLVDEDFKGPEYGEVKVMLNLHFYGYLYLLQSIQQHNPGEKIKIVSVSKNNFSLTTKEKLNPAHAGLFGLNLVAPQELPNIRCRVIDVDELQLQHIDMLTEDIVNDTKDTVLAYRGNKKWVPLYEPLQLEQSIIKQDVFREKGVYLIVGGAGMIGWMIGSHLALKYCGVLVLMQRSFPEKNEWELWIKEHGTEDDTSRKIMEMQDAEKNGAVIEIVKGDAASYDQTSKIVEAVERKYGSIHGVIQCTNDMGSSFYHPISQLDADTCETLFHSKIGAVLTLDKVFGNKQLDFCLLMSSTASVLGGYGFAAYSAANAFLDSYTVMRNQCGLTKWKVVNWEAWSKQAQKEGQFQSSVSNLAMNKEEGIDCLYRVLSAAQVERIIHSPGDLNDRIDVWVRQNKQVKMPPNQQPCRKETVTQSMADYERASNEIQKTITALWENYLGLEDISIHDNFFDLGATSLTLIQMKALLEQELQIEIEITDLFTYTTILSLAEKISETKDKKAVGDMEEKMKNLEQGRNNLVRISALRNKEVSYE